ncbi:helix-turn-helix transcriptional regulator [Pseudomonas sp. V104_10]|uniref:helix-turn-helix domain-containing protein n=1 Tax=Pseudomonas sp. V104_10 TaxID=3044231 RepID=UPI00249F3A0A|nr:helix-turn-helix transcriptional regulator [Pseudomonas sp. V104_10]MDI3372391.1 helix-turn-helix transcriptional regulator [Pseudomonas sp. V104_10]
MTKTNTDRRELEDWEKDECAALKHALALYNAPLPREKKLTQDKLAAELGMTQGNLNGHLNGKRPLSKELAAKVFSLTGIPVSAYSTRLDAEIKSLAAAVLPNGSLGTPDTQENQELTGTSHATPYVVRLISAALARGMLTADDSEELRRLAIHLIKKNEALGARFATIPENLDALAESLLSTSEAGGNVDDMLKMLEHGMKKSRPMDSARSHEPSKKKGSH